MAVDHRGRVRATGVKIAACHVVVLCRRRCRFSRSPSRMRSIWESHRADFDPPIFHRPFRGVRSLGGASGTSERCHAYLPIMQPGQLFSHLTAARLLDFPLPPRLQLSDEIDIWAEGVQAKTAGIIGHRSAVIPSRLVDGLPVVDPSHVFVQIANMLGRDDLVAVGDYLVRRSGRYALSHRWTPSFEGREEYEEFALSVSRYRKSGRALTRPWKRNCGLLLYAAVYRNRSSGTRSLRPMVLLSELRTWPTSRSASRSNTRAMFTAQTAACFTVISSGAN